MAKYFDIAEDVVSAAERAALLEEILFYVSAGVVIIDGGGNIVFFNAEAERLFGYSADELYEQPVEVLLPERFRERHIFLREHYVREPSRRAMGHERNLWGCHKDGSEFPVEVGLGYAQKNGALLITASVVNIATRKAAEQEREILINELRDALDHVQQLSGLLPICASCKKIRDDNGYWNQIETYIREHSEVEFSHSICPECVEKLYPGLSLKKE